MDSADAHYNQNYECQWKNAPQTNGSMTYNQEKEISENKLDFLYELYKKDVNIGHDNIGLLISKGYLKKKEKEQEEEREEINQYNLTAATTGSKEAEKHIDILEEDYASNNMMEVITSDELEERRSKYKHIFEGREQPITRDDWAPKSTIDHDPEFVNWINSINTRGFMNKVHYRKFSLYCQQAYQWLSETNTAIDYEEEEDRMDYYLQELNRCAENALYFLNKYCYYKEGDAGDKSGRIRYVARPVH